jgi:hypothetical protein
MRGIVGFVCLVLLVGALFQPDVSVTYGPAQVGGGFSTVDIKRTGDVINQNAEVWCGASESTCGDARLSQIATSGRASALEKLGFADYRFGQRVSSVNNVPALPKLGFVPHRRRAILRHPKARFRS